MHLCAVSKGARGSKQVFDLLSFWFGRTPWLLMADSLDKTARYLKQKPHITNC